MKRHLLAILILGVFAACGGGGGSNASTPPPTVSVTLTPATATVTAGSTRSFAAQVVNSANTAVTWSASAGTITATGLFTAPASPGSATVTATSVADSSKSASATVAIVPPPSTPTVTAPAQATQGMPGLTASVPARADMTYTWTLAGGAITSPGGSSGQTSGGINSITWTAGVEASASLSCVETNAAADASAPGQVSVALNPAPLTPVITVPAHVTAGSAGLAASVPARPGMAYIWALTGGAITSPGGTSGQTSGSVNSITWTAGPTGTATLICVEVNATPTSSPAGSATVGVEPVPHGLPTVQGFPAVTQNTMGWTASVPAFPGATYAWTVTGVGALDGGHGTSSITWHATGLGTVTIGCTVTNLAGASDAQSVSVQGVAGGIAYTATPPSPGRMRHTAILLLDGRVLVAGGQDISVAGQINGLATAERFNPATNAFTPTAGHLSTGRYYHTATLLPDGRVLLAGGIIQETLGTLGAQQMTATAELYDPATDAFIPTGSMNHSRAFHTASLLPDGSVLITGGTGTRCEWTAEVYDPSAGVFTPLVSTLAHPRDSHRATTLWDGRVLLSGGEDRAAGTMTATAELFDPATGAFGATGDLAVGRWRHAASLLADGRVLLTGGRDAADAYLSDSAIWTPGTGLWTAGPAMGYTHSSHGALLLPNGATLITGTFGIEGRQELFSADAAGVAYTCDTRDTRSGGTATLLVDGRVLLVGGTYGEGGNINPTAELWSPGDTSPHASTLPGGQAVVKVGKSLPVFAVISGASNASVAWALLEGASGGTLSAAAGNGMLYTAPATAGTYHLVATCAADGATSATLTVVVR